MLRAHTKNVCLLIRKFILFPFVIYWKTFAMKPFSFLPGFKFSVMMAGLGTVTGGLLSSAASDWSSGVWSGLSLADISRLVSSVYRTSHDTRMV